MTTESEAKPAETPTPTSPTDSSSTATPAQPNPTDLGTDDKPAEKPAEPATDLGAEDKPPEAETKEEAPPAWAEYHGAPEEGKDYELVAPDGLAIDEVLKAEFTPVARELNLSAKGAQRLVDLKAKDVQLQQQRWGEHLTELKATAEKDPEIGGAKYNESVAAGRRVISKYGTPGLRKLMNDYGVGAHPEMIRFMRKIDAAMGEPSTLPSGDGPGVVNQKPLHEILYKDS